MGFKTVAGSPKAAQLISNCFHVRTLTHIAHLQTTNYAQHIALGTFYTGIVDLADAFAEAFQGRNGIITSYPTPTISGDGLAAIENLRIWIDHNRTACGQHQELQNDIDTILSFCDSAIYKLTNLH